MKKLLSMLLVVTMMLVLAMGCSKEEEPGNGKTSEAAETGEKVSETTEVVAVETTVPEGGFVIGVSNGYIGNGWRTQMIDSIEKLGEYYKGQGLIKEIIIQNAGVDVNNQIAQIRNLINAEVDLLMIDPNSETALNPVIEEAYEAGIPVISFDAPVSSEKALNVVVDQVAFGRNLAQWFVDELDGEGDIVIVSGIAGHPANVNRLKGMQEVLDANPGIKVLAEVNGNWDQASAQQAMSNLIASYPDIDGVLTQDGMALGCINAYEAAGLKVPVITGETMMGFVQKWNDLRGEGFATYAQNNPPGIGATALGIGVRMLQGKEATAIKGMNYFYPISYHVTNDNFDSYYEKYQFEPDSYFIDEWLSEEELDALFE